MTTATVQTLVAEVRTLMVGSRQVTLSVYRQLDNVHFENCEPFGRVNVGGESENQIRLVGRSTTDGSLVASTVELEAGIYAAPIDFKHWLWHGSAVEDREHWLDVYQASPVKWTDCTLVSHHPFVDDCSNLFDSLRVAWVERLRLDEARLKMNRAEFRAAQQLPLIVLAGLK